MSETKVIIIGVPHTSATSQAILERLKNEGHSVEVRESESFEIKPPKLEPIEMVRTQVLDRPLKPHRGKHRTPQNKYR